jgi:hypothetical protein
MSDLWKTLLSRGAPDFEGILELNRVRVTRDAASMEVSFYSSRLLTGNEINIIRDAFANALPRTKISVGISYPALSGDVRGSIESYAPFLIDLISHSQPACRAFLINAEWRLNGDKLTLKTENESGASYLNEREIPARLRRIMWDLFSVECEADIIVNKNPMVAMDAESSEEVSRLFDD